MVALNSVFITDSPKSIGAGYMKWAKPPIRPAKLLTNGKNDAKIQQF
jgi:hypothetical protein